MRRPDLLEAALQKRHTVKYIVVIDVIDVVGQGLSITMCYYHIYLPSEYLLVNLRPEKNRWEEYCQLL
jgi:hypothetical protein